MSGRPRTAVNLIAAGALLLLVAAAVLGRTSASDPSADTGSTVAVEATTGDPLATAIGSAQQRLAEVPGDHRTWAELGGAYVEMARITADPSYYPKAEGALQKSLALRKDNDLALTGLGALANARHEFADAAGLAQDALDLNPFSAAAWGVLTDARTQLGDYAGAREALGRMLDLQPGVASFTRASYDAELHGNTPDARAALEQALDRAGSPADEAFCRTYLGGLAFSTGDLDEASDQFSAGLAKDPGNPGLLLGQARVLAARGQVGAAVQAYRSVVAARPLPEHLAEFGDYLLSLGRSDEADQQYALVDTVRQLFAVAGVQDDLGEALFDADHGNPDAAVAAASAEFGRRQNIDAHDAMAWALHSAGRDAEALPHADAATALGGHNALFLYHRGAIEATLGQDDEARRTLAAAVDANPYFSVLHASDAQELLASLGGPR